MEEKKKLNFGGLATDAGKAAAGFLGRAKKAVVEKVDQNADGELDITDITLIADSVKSAVKDTGERLSEKQEKLRRERELNSLRPIFEEGLESVDFSLSKLIRVTDIDKKHSESELCKGSIGYYYEDKNLQIVNVYKDNAPLFGLSFYPDLDREVYYVDPTDRDHYIALDDYFNYLKVERINELQRIAQDLGARHFKVTFMEESVSSSEVKKKEKIGFKALAKQSANEEAVHEASEKSYSKSEIAAEMECIPHEPVTPRLVYLAKDSSVQNLINMRLNKNLLMHHKFSINLITSSGIRVNDAIKIDAALNAMKCMGNASITSQAQKESRSYFEYEIDFE